MTLRLELNIRNIIKTWIAAKIPLGRLGISDYIAAMGLILMSNRYAGYVTGAEIVVDGGLSLHNWFPPAVA